MNKLLFLSYNINPFNVRSGKILTKNEKIIISVLRFVDTFLITPFVFLLLMIVSCILQNLKLIIILFLLFYFCL